MPFSEVQRAIIGRWNVTVQKPEGKRPAWLEVRTSGDRTLVHLGGNI